MNDKLDKLARWPTRSPGRKRACNLCIVVVLASTGNVSVAGEQFGAWSSPVNLGSSINTAYDEFHSAISSDGLSLYFASERPGSFGQTDLWVAQRSNRNANWEPALNLGPDFNTPYGEYSVELSPDGHWLFFASEGQSGNDLNIYAAFRGETKDNFGWGLPLDLGKGVNSPHANADPTLFIDPETGVTVMYFARLNTPGQGDWDIYVTTLGSDGTFGDAVLVSELSTRYRDTHPTVRRDGLEIIFSSNRPGSIGGIDLLVSTRLTTHDKWSTPTSLGPGINSSSDDRAPYLTDDGQTMIFTSNRPGGFDGNDFYLATRKKL